MDRSAWLHQEVQQLQLLMRRKLGVRGDFGAALRRAERHLPGSARQAGAALVQALPMADHPKLERTIDRPKLTADVAELRAALEAIDVKERRRTALLSLLGSIVFSLLGVVVLVVVLLVWRGVI